MQKLKSKVTPTPYEVSSGWESKRLLSIAWAAPKPLKKLANKQN
ncbi:hypothetical protein [Vibrio aestuarianus]|nr:hypothetical protein [Vibrio aestuarianus]